MEKDRKRQLIQEYKQSKPDMGILGLFCIPTGKSYIGYAQNLKGKINGQTFQLRAGTHPNKELQKAWQEYGEEGFTVQVLEILPYLEEKLEDSNSDYTADLLFLRDTWLEKTKGAEEL